jgi:collagenase-like PrtC family protease
MLEVVETTTEIRALKLALLAKADEVYGPEARLACRDLLEEASLPDTAEGRVIRVAASLVGRREFDPPCIEGTGLREAIARAWVAWVAGHEVTCIEGHPRGPVLDALALRYWRKAIQALIEGDPDEANLWFPRAAHFSSEYATDSNALIQWTFAATRL